MHRPKPPHPQRKTNGTNRLKYTPKPTNQPNRVKFSDQAEKVTKSTQNNLLKLLSVTVIPLGSVGPEDNVTGSSTLIKCTFRRGKQTMRENYLVDFGLFQGIGDDKLGEYNRDLPFTRHGVKISDLTGVLFTHPHADHYGKGPLLVKDHKGQGTFNGEIYMHYAAIDLIRLGLTEHVDLIEKKVQRLKTQKLNIKKRIRELHKKAATEAVEFTNYIKKEDVYLGKGKISIEIFLKDENRISDLVSSENFSKDEKYMLIDKIFKEKIALAEKEGLFKRHHVTSLISRTTTTSGSTETKIGNTGNINLRLIKSGHMIGATQPVISIKDDNGNVVNILLTGDLGRQNHFVLPAPDVPNIQINFMICESTYGGEYHENFEEGVAKLKEKLKEVIRRKGKILFPCFKTQRMQDVLYQVIKLVDEIKTQLRWEIRNEYKEGKAKATEELIQGEAERELSHIAGIKSKDIINSQLIQQANKLAQLQLQEKGMLMDEKDIVISNDEIERHLAQERKRIITEQRKNRIQQEKDSGKFDLEVEKLIEQRVDEIANGVTAKVVRRTKQHIPMEMQNQMFEQNKAKLLKRKNEIEKIRKSCTTRYIQNIRTQIENEVIQSEIQYQENLISQATSKLTSLFSHKLSIGTNNGIPDILKQKQSDYLNNPDTVSLIEKESKDRLDNMILQIVNKEILKLTNKNGKKKLTQDEINKFKEDLILRYKNDNEFITRNLNTIKIIVTNELIEKQKRIIEEQLSQELFDKTIEEIKNSLDGIEIEQEIKQEFLAELIEKINNDISSNAAKLVKKKHGKNLSQKARAQLISQSINELKLYKLREIILSVYQKTNKKYLKNIETDIRENYKKLLYEGVRKILFEKVCKKVERHNKHLIESSLKEKINELVLIHVREKYGKNIREKILADREFKKLLDELKKSWDKKKTQSLEELNDIPICAAGANLQEINSIFTNKYTKDGEKVYDQVLNHKVKGIKKSRVQIIEDIHRNPFFGKLDSKGNPVKKFPAILCASSGMIAGGMISAFLERTLKDPNNCLIRVGYMGSKTPGRRIVEAMKSGADVVFTNEFGELKLEAEILETPIFSTHADQSDIEAHIEKINFAPGAQLYLNHGSPERQQACIEGLKANAIIAQKKLEIAACIIGQPIQIFHTNAD